MHGTRDNTCVSAAFIRGTAVRGSVRSTVRACSSAWPSATPSVRGGLFTSYEAGKTFGVSVLSQARRARVGSTTLCFHSVVGSTTLYFHSMVFDDRFGLLLQARTLALRAGGVHDAGATRAGQAPREVALGRKCAAGAQVAAGLAARSFVVSHLHMRAAPSILHIGGRSSCFPKCGTKEVQVTTEADSGTPHERSPHRCRSCSGRVLQDVKTAHCAAVALLGIRPVLEARFAHCTAAESIYIRVCERMCWTEQQF